MPPERNPSVSVCITTYKHEKYIEKCIRSVLDQDYDGKIEVLVADDCSPDGTPEIITRLSREDERVKPVLQTENCGPNENFKTVFRMTTGDLIAHLDGDDYWFPEKLSRQIEVLNVSPKVIAVYSNSLVISPDNSGLGLFNSNQMVGRIDINELFRRGNFLNNSSLIYRSIAKEFLLSTNGHWIDYRTHLRLVSIGELAYLNEPLLAHRWRTPGSMISCLPKEVADGLLVTLVEALEFGAEPANVRRTAGIVWGKMLINGVIERNFKTADYFIQELSKVSDLRLTVFWKLTQFVLCPLRAMKALVIRRNGIFFP
jgi:glycosyltransferase involved in cell wall biosynthesis